MGVTRVQGLTSPSLTTTWGNSEHDSKENLDWEVIKQCKQHGDNKWRRAAAGGGGAAVQRYFKSLLFLISSRCRSLPQPFHLGSFSPLSQHAPTTTSSSKGYMGWG